MKGKLGMMKRILGMMLAALLLATSLPVGAFAEVPGENIPGTVEDGADVLFEEESLDGAGIVPGDEEEFGEALPGEEDAFRREG